MFAVVLRFSRFDVAPTRVRSALLGVLFLQFQIYFYIKASPYRCLECENSARVSLCGCANLLVGCLVCLSRLTTDVRLSVFVALSDSAAFLSARRRWLGRCVDLAD